MKILSSHIFLVVIWSREFKHWSPGT